jgi:hypothetical protein
MVGAGNNYAVVSPLVGGWAFIGETDKYQKPITVMSCCTFDVISPGLTIDIIIFLLCSTLRYSD